MSTVSQISEGSAGLLVQNGPCLLIAVQSVGFDGRMLDPSRRRPADYGLIVPEWQRKNAFVNF
jgi:hypothetical protein